MPYAFPGIAVDFEAKGGVTQDGEDFTTDSGTGQTVPTFPSNNTAFAGVPTRTGVGVWKVSLKETASKMIGRWVAPVVAVGGVTGATMQPETTDALGRTVLNWTFINAAGTATDIGVSKKFNVYAAYTTQSGN